MNKNKIKRVISTMMLLVLAVLTGLTVGNLYISSIPPETIVEGSEAQLRDDIADLIEKMNSGKYSVTDFTAKENYQLAEYVLYNQEEYKRIEKGIVKAVAAGVINQTQAQQAIKIKKGENYMVEKMSQGLVSVAKRFYFDGENVSYYSGNNIRTENGLLVANYPTTPAEVLTHEKYQERYNTKFTNTMPYIVSSITFYNDYKITSSHKNEDGTYTFSIDFYDDYAKLAGYYYSYDVKYTSDLTQIPNVSHLGLTITINQNWEFVNVKYVEEYTMLYTAGITCSVRDDFDEDFFYTCDEIPQVG